MKKTLIVLCAIILLTGCSNKTTKISCSTDNANTKVTFSLDYNESNKTSSNGKVTMDLKFDTLTDEQFETVKSQDFCSMMLSNLNTGTDMYSNCQSSINNKIVTLTFDLDLEKLETFENGAFKVKMNKEDIISYFEKQDATCN